MPSLAVVFILGTTNDQELTKSIREEAKTHGDILQEDFVDSYVNLTVKSVMMLKFVNSLKSIDVKYVLKVRHSPLYRVKDKKESRTKLQLINTEIIK